MPRRSSVRFLCRMSLPSNKTRPSDGSIERLIIRSDVVLPQPEGPTKTVMRPVAHSSETSSNARVPSGYVFTTFSNVITIDSESSELLESFATCKVSALDHVTHQGDTRPVSQVDV